MQPRNKDEGAPAPGKRRAKKFTWAKARAGYYAAIFKLRVVDLRATKRPVSSSMLVIAKNLMKWGCRRVVEIEMKSPTLPSRAFSDFSFRLLRICSWRDKLISQDHVVRRERQLTLARSLGCGMTFNALIYNIVIAIGRFFCKILAFSKLSSSLICLPIFYLDFQFARYGKIVK